MTFMFRPDMQDQPLSVLSVDCLVSIIEAKLSNDPRYSESQGKITAYTALMKLKQLTGPKARWEIGNRVVMDRDKFVGMILALMNKDQA